MGRREEATEWRWREREGWREKETRSQMDLESIARVKIAREAAERSIIPRPPTLRGRKAMCWPGKRRVGKGTSSFALPVVASRRETERCIRMRWPSGSKLILYTALEARHWFAAWTRPERGGSRSIQRRALVDMEAAIWLKAESTAAEVSEAEGTPRLTQISSGLERRYPVRGWCSWREGFNVSGREVPKGRWRRDMTVLGMDWEGRPAREARAKVCCTDTTLSVSGLRRRTRCLADDPLFFFFFRN